MAKKHLRIPEATWYGMWRLPYAFKGYGKSEREKCPKDPPFPQSSVLGPHPHQYHITTLPLPKLLSVFP